MRLIAALSLLSLSGFTCSREKKVLRANRAKPNNHFNG